MSWEIRQGDCIEEMAKLDESSVDAVVCDPPYGLEFMGKEWDRLWNGVREAKPEGYVGSDGVRRKKTQPMSATIAQGAPSYEGGLRAQQWHHAWATEALRVLKPGGHLLAAGGSRTFHRLVSALEDAGFEIRDCITHLYGSGFPKSLDVSKAIDKAAGAEREVIGKTGRCIGPSQAGEDGIGTFKETNWEQSDNLTAPTTPEAQQWQGWGTALKPAAEFWTLARKPLVGTVAQNVQEHGTGALNVDGCRVEGGAYSYPEGAGGNTFTVAGEPDGSRTEPVESHPSGRWPANVVLDEESARLLDEQSGTLTSGAWNGKRGHPKTQNAYGDFELADERAKQGDSGGASRFFYCAKSSRAERNAGLEGFEEEDSQHLAAKALRECNVCGTRAKAAGPGGRWPNCDHDDWSKVAARDDGHKGGRARNAHPTVKPIALMRWLCRLVTPPGGLILDPFVGSGTTGCAAILEGFDFLGIEREVEYVEIAKARIAHWAAQPVQLGLEAA